MLVSLMLGLAVPAASAAELQALTDIPLIQNPGEIDAYRYVPDSPAAQPALIVLLHGCQQTAQDFARTGWIDLAERSGSILLLPEQQSANNAFRCWNWFLADDLGDRGEMASIVNLVERERTARAIGSERVFVAGLSAGGWMTATLLTAHSELFAGGGVLAGGPAYCARVENAWWDPFGWWTLWRGASEAKACMAGRDRSGIEWRRIAHAPHTSPGPLPPLSIWQGSADAVVAPLNATELIEQWGALLGIDVEPDTTERLGPDGLITKRTFTDGDGRAVIEAYRLDRMRHGIPISPGCGQPSDFVIDVGICAAEQVGRFWGVLPPE